MLIDDISRQLEIICNYKTNSIAAKNILQARISAILGYTGVTFTSYANLKKPTPLAYYAFNFVPSGGVKNLLLDEINNNLFPFFDMEIEEFNTERYAALSEDLDKKMLNGIDSGNDLKREQQELKLKQKQFQIFTPTLTSSTQAKMYELLEIIKKEQKGSLCLENTEFANYFSEAFLGRNNTNKEVINMLFNLYDGKFDATNTVQTNRRNLSGIPFSCVLMSDPKIIIESGSLMQQFLNYMGSGMARRSFIYYRPNENYYIDYKDVSVQQKQEAYNKLEKYSQSFKNIFKFLLMKNDKNFTCSDECNQKIIKHNQWIFGQMKGFYKINDYLDDKTNILKLNIEHSTWKIIKLAFMYHLINNPMSNIIESKYFDMAFDYFQETHESLKNMLFAENINDTDKLFNYLFRNINKWQNKSILRQQNFVNSVIFKSWLESEALPIVMQKAEKKGYIFAERVTGKNNCGYEMCIYDPNQFNFNCYQENDKIKGELVDKKKTGFIKVDSL